MLEMAEGRRNNHVWRDVRDTNRLIKEHQEARSFGFPHFFAPERKLKEHFPNNYMQIMKMHYAFRKSSENLILELKEENFHGEVISYVKVGEAFSVDFKWNEYESIRLHLVAIWKNNDRMTEHYQVMDFGVAGLGFTIPNQAWENWRLWGRTEVTGVPIDIRMIYMLIGDRNQIGAMSLEEFAHMTCDQVEALTRNMKPGMVLNRPTINDARMEEIPDPSTPPPVIEITSSSSSSGSESKKSSGRVGKTPKVKRKLNPKDASRGASWRNKTGPIPSTYQHMVPPKPFNFKAWNNQRYMDDPPRYLDAEGKPFSREIAINLDKLFTECVHGSPECSPDEVIEGWFDPDQVEGQREESFYGDTSGNDSGKDTSRCDISGISAFQRESLEEEPETDPMDESTEVEVFLADKMNESQIVNVSSSTDSSGGQVAGGGQASGGAEMDF